MAGPQDVGAALNRVADALFQQAKSHARQVKVSERQVAIQESLLDMQQANLAVTRQLEAKLAAQVQLETDTRHAATGQR